MRENQDKIESTIKSYYDDMVKTYGANHNGVDWNSSESQYLRFEQLDKVIREKRDAEFSIIDFGCGYGELVNFLNHRYNSFEYVGLDISAEMLKQAKQKHNQINIFFAQHLHELDEKDYLLASGIFNIKQQTKLIDWDNYCLELLNEFNRFCRKGFSFNVLTKYSEESQKKKLPLLC